MNSKTLKYQYGGGQMKKKKKKAHKKKATKKKSKTSETRIMFPSSSSKYEQFIEFVAEKSGKSPKYIHDSISYSTYQIINSLLLRGVDYDKYYSEKTEEFNAIMGLTSGKKATKKKATKKKAKKTKKAKAGTAGIMAKWMDKFILNLIEWHKQKDPTFSCSFCKKDKKNTEWSGRSTICSECYHDKYGSYDVHQEHNKKEKKKSTSQKGGALCLPCVTPILSGLGILGTGAIASRSFTTTTKSKSEASNGNIKRKQEFKMKDKVNGKTKEVLFKINQKNNVVTYKQGKKKKVTKKFKTIKQASKFYDKKISECK